MADTNEADWAQAEKTKKKKKSKKKKEEEAAATEPEPEPEQEQQWPPQTDNELEADVPAAEEAPVDEALVNGEAPPLGDDFDFDRPQQIEKRKSPFPVFWNRPKAKMYKMNFDYGETYYSNMMAYLNSKSTSLSRNHVQPPKAQSWAERAHNSATLRYPRQEADLSAMLHTVRSSIRNYDMHHRQYTSKVQSVYGTKAI